MPVESPRTEWAGLFTDAVLFAASRLEHLPPEAAVLIEAATERVWSLESPADSPDLVTCHWRLFGFRAMVGSVEHAVALSRFNPSSRQAALELAADVCGWELPATFDEAMAFLDSQADVHRQMLKAVRREIRLSSTLASR